MIYFIEAAGALIETRSGSEGRVLQNYRRYRLSRRWLEFRRESGETQRD